MTRKLILLAVLAAGLALVLNCGSDAPQVGLGEGSYRRLVLRHATPQAKPRSQVVQTLVPSPGLDGWQVTGAKSSFTKAKPVHGDFRPELPEKAQRIPAVVLNGAGPKQLRIPGDYDPRSFNQVVLQLAVYGSQPEPVRVGFERKGKLVLVGPWLSVPSTEGGFATPVAISLPHARRAGGGLDAIRLEFRGVVKTSSVSRIELVHSPLSAYLPAPAGPAQVSEVPGGLVTVGGEERRGVGLSSRTPLTCSFEVPEEAELSFSYGLDERLRVWGEEPVVSLVLTLGDREVLRESFELESSKRNKQRWHGQRFPLAEWSGQELTARFELEVEGDHEGFAVVAEAALCRRGEGAPTVVLITSDTHRADHLSITGGPVRTPVLDALAKRGVLFEDTHASTNVTNPSHVALMTATTPRDTHILNNSTPLVGRAVTLAERFAAAGYRTYGAVSAYHLLHEESGLGQGFDRLNGPKQGERDGAETLDLLDGWLEEAVGQPLFVWLHLFDAHAPYRPPSKLAERYWDGSDPYDPDSPEDLPGIELPPFLSKLRDKDYPYAMYRGEVDYVDQLMGRLLESQRIAGGILAFTADHGESFGEHGIWWDHADLYPETVAVPLILVWPDGPRGERTRAPVEQIDIGRTLLDLAGLEQADFPGRDLRWALEGSSAAQARFSISAHGMVASVQSGPWQLHLHLRRHQEWALEFPREAHEVQLYNLAEDPSSLNDLAKDPAHFRRAQRLRQSVIDWVNDASPVGLGTTKVMTEEAQRSLADLGYTGGESGPALFESDSDNPWDAYFEPE
jgi:arylsulfatase A-like enzyme